MGNLYRNRLPGVDPPTRMLTWRAATPSRRAAAVVVVVAGRCCSGAWAVSPDLASGGPVADGVLAAHADRRGPAAARYLGLSATRRPGRWRRPGGAEGPGR